MSTPILVIANPASSGGAGARAIPRVESFLRARGEEFELARTGRPGDAVRIAAERGREFERLLVVGGDGTLHETVNGLLSRDPHLPIPALAVAPVGTGNDFYRMVGSTPTLEDATDAILQGKSRAFDLGRVRWEGGEAYFVNLFGVGIDVAVLRRRARFQRLPGLLQYLAALLAALFTFEPVGVRIHLEGETLEGTTTLSAITVGPSAGGGFLVSPAARPDDGLLDLCHVRGLGFFQVLRYLPRVIRGTHGDLPVVELRTLTRARVESPDRTGLPFQLDGELMDPEPTWLEVEIVPGKLPVLLPAVRGKSSRSGAVGTASRRGTR